MDCWPSGIESAIIETQGRFLQEIPRVQIINGTQQNERKRKFKLSWGYAFCDFIIFIYYFPTATNIFCTLLLLLLFHPKSSLCVIYMLWFSKLSW